MADLKMRITIRVKDEALLRAAARDFNPGLSPDASIEDAISAAVLTPNSPPPDCGFEIERQSITAGVETARGTIYAIDLTAGVRDAERLVDAARDSYRAAWGDVDWQPKTLGEAVYEILVASSSGPAPADIGFAIIEPTYLVDLEAPSVPEGPQMI